MQAVKLKSVMLLQFICCKQYLAHSFLKVKLTLPSLNTGLLVIQKWQIGPPTVILLNSCFKHMSWLCIVKKGRNQLKVQEEKMSLMESEGEETGPRIVKPTNPVFQYGPF